MENPINLKWMIWGEKPIIFAKHLGATLHPPAGSPWLKVLTCFLRVRANAQMIIEETYVLYITVYVLYNLYV